MESFKFQIPLIDSCNASNGSLSATSSNDTESPRQEEEELSKRIKRNLREQSRAQKITEQVQVLSSMLFENNITHLTDKVSVLGKTIDYLKWLIIRNRELEEMVEVSRRIISELNRKVEAFAVEEQANEERDHCEQQNVDGQRSYSQADDSTIEVQFGTLFYPSQIPSALIRENGRIVDTNDSFEKAIGISRSQLLRSTLFDLLHPMDIQKHFRSLVLFLSSHSNLGDFEHPPELRVRAMLHQSTAQQAWFARIFPIPASAQIFAQSPVHQLHQQQQLCFQPIAEFSIFPLLTNSGDRAYFHVTLVGSYVPTTNSPASISSVSSDAVAATDLAFDPVISSPGASAAMSTDDNHVNRGEPENAKRKQDFEQLQ